MTSKRERSVIVVFGVLYMDRIRVEARLSKSIFEHASQRPGDLLPRDQHANFSIAVLDGDFDVAGKGPRRTPGEAETIPRHCLAQRKDGR